MIATQTVACANKVHDRANFGQPHHESVAVVRECFSTPGGLLSIEEQEYSDSQDHGSYDYDPDAAYERHLESAGYNEARAQEDWEAQKGIQSYEEAREEALVAALAEQQALPIEEQMQAAPEDRQPLRDGIYTVTTEQGHRTLRLRTQGSEDKFAPGKQIVSYLSGSDNDSDYTSFAFIAGEPGFHRLAPWKRYRDNQPLLADAQRLLDDPDAALESAECYRCHRRLTTPESIAMGIGPECAKKGI